MAQLTSLAEGLMVALLAVSSPVPSAVAQAIRTDVGCGDVLAFQVLLWRQGFSAGEIDGLPGANFSRAIAAFQETRGLAPTGKADCATWEALGGGSADAVTTIYRISDADVQGPFTETIPRALPAQARLPALGYTSIVERLAERFRTSPKALRRLNPHAAFKANTDIEIPAVDAFDIGSARPQPVDNAADMAVIVARDGSSLRVIGPDGSLVFFAPVTTGSEHDPLPVGDWKVKGLRWLPVFHYNPELFWDAQPGDSKATLKAGPNNPVGVVWIDLDVEHYGIHGTPDPGRVGHAESHGCVRLTNWDAAKLASLVAPGTPVQFR